MNWGAVVNKKRQLTSIFPDDEFANLLSDPLDSVSGNSKDSSEQSNSLGSDGQHRHRKKHRSSDRDRHARRHYERPPRDKPVHRVSRRGPDDDDDNIIAELNNDKDQKLEKLLAFKGERMHRWEDLTGQLVEDDEDERARLKEIEKLLASVYESHKMQNESYFGSRDNNNATVKKTECVICAYTGLDPLSFSKKCSAFHAMSLCDVMMIGDIQGNQLLQNCANAFNRYQEEVKREGGHITHTITVHDVKRHMMGCSIGNPLRPIEFQVRMCQEMIERGSEFIFGHIDNNESRDPFWNTSKTKLLISIMKYHVQISEKFWKAKSHIMKQIHAQTAGGMGITVVHDGAPVKKEESTNNRHLAVTGGQRKWGGNDLK